MIIFTGFVIVLTFVVGSSRSTCTRSVVTPTPSPSPQSGVHLYHENVAMIIPNNSMINSSLCDNCYCSDVLWCLSAPGANNGIWYNTSGGAINTDRLSLCSELKNDLLHVCMADNKNEEDEQGIYTCQLTDEDNVEQIFVVAIYSPSSIGTISITDTQLQVPTDLDSSQFSISFTVENGTATDINCTINGTNTTNFDITQNVLSYTLPIKISVVLTFHSRSEGLYNCSISNAFSSDFINTIIRVANKPTDLFVDWINTNTANAKWSAPVDNDSPIAYYKVFYESCVHDNKVHGSIMTNTTEVNITELINCLDYMIYVVAYSNETNTLPSERSEMKMLPNNSFCGQCIPSIITTCISCQCTITKQLSTQTDINIWTFSSSVLSLTDSHHQSSAILPSQTQSLTILYSSCVQQSESSSLQTPLVAGISGILLLTNLLTVTALIGSCVCILRLKQNKLTLKSRARPEQVTLTGSTSRHISTGTLYNTTTGSQNTSAAAAGGGGGGTTLGNTYAFIDGEQQETDPHVSYQYETPLDLAHVRGATHTSAAALPPDVYSTLDVTEDDHEYTAPTAAASAGYTYATVNKRQEGYTYATVDKSPSTKRGYTEDQEYNRLQHN